MIITKTPFRMSFFGGGTDMPSFFRENGGSVLSTTFDKYCYVNVRHLPRFFDYSTELSYSKTERVGFLLSATKDIVKVQGDKKAISEVVGDTLVAKLILVLVAFVSLLVMIATRSNWERKRNNTYNDYYRIFADWRTFNFIINWTV